MNENILNFDLFKLQLPLEDRSSFQWICAYGRNLENQINNLLLESNLNKNKISKFISKKFNLSNSTTQKMLYGRKYIPLIVIEEIIKEWKRKQNKNLESYKSKIFEIQRSIERLKIASSKKSLKFNNELTENLAKTCGAHAADGSLVLYLNFYSSSLKKITDLKNVIEKTFNKKVSKIAFRKKIKMFTVGLSISSKERELLKKLNLNDIIISTTYQIGLIDENHFAVSKFKSWIGDCFDIHPEINPYHNAWTIKFNSKIIGRLLNLIFDFPLGKKSSTVNEPQIIRNAPLKYRKAFAQGVMTFDGSVELRQAVRLDVKSEKLRDSIKEILALDGLSVTNYNYGEDYTFHSSINLNKKIAKKWLKYFVKGSEKWHKLNDIVHGFQGYANSIEEFENTIRTVYRRQGKSKVELFDIFDSARNLNEFTRLQIESQKNISKSQTLGYLRILMRMNILTKTVGKNGLYVFNDDMKSWKVPFRSESKIIGLELPKE